ncbi:hypothetical protein MTO96_045920, partial [Rhipicephalus appendiculatus]
MRRRPSVNLSTWRCLNNAATTPRLCRGHLSRQINQRTAHPPFRRSKLTFFNSSRAGVAAERTQEERLRPELLLQQPGPKTSGPPAKPRRQPSGKDANPWQGSNSNATTWSGGIPSSQRSIWQRCPQPTQGTIPSEHMLNVIVSAFSTKDKDVLSGALDTFKEAESSSLFLDHVGFDISGYESLNVIADTYEDLGITQHRWQGDGMTNCLIAIYWELRTEDATSRRTAANTTHDYVDKVYVWTVDTPFTIRRFL